MMNFTKSIHSASISLLVLAADIEYPTWPHLQPSFPYKAEAQCKQTDNTVTMLMGQMLAQFTDWDKH